MKKTTTLIILFIMSIGVNAQPLALDTNFISHFDFRSQNNPVVYNIYEQQSGNIVINGNFLFSNGATPHHGVVSYNRNGSLNSSFLGTFASGRSFTYSPINDSVYYLGDFNSGNLVDSFGVAVDTAWSNNLSFSLPCATRTPFFFQDGSALVINGQSQSTQNPCDVYLGTDTFPGNYLEKIHPNGVWDSTFNITTIGSPNTMINYDSNRLILAGLPTFFTNYNGIAIRGLCRVFNNGLLDPSFQSPIKDTTASSSFTIQSVNSDGTMFLTGRFYLQGYSQQFTIVKLLSNGSLDPSFMNLNGPTDSRNIANSVSAVVKTDDGGYLVGGTFDTYQGNSIRNLAKIDSLGNVENQYFQGLGPDSSSGNGLFFSTVTTITKSKFGGYYIGGDFLRHNGLPSQPIYRIYDLKNGVGISETNLKTRFHKLYPNPVYEKITLEFEVNRTEQVVFRIHGIHGNLIQEDQLNNGSLHYINTTSLKPGVYFYEIRNNKGEYVSGKLMIQ